MSIFFRSSGSFEKTTKFLTHLASSTNALRSLERYGREGVAALASATPVDSGLTASRWTYEVVQTEGTYSIIWGNTNIEDGRLIAVLLQYGHATRTGGYVSGRDYINPALRPILDRMAAEGWKVVTKQ